VYQDVASRSIFETGEIVEKSVQAMLNQGLVSYQGVLFPRQFKVTLIDSDGAPGARKPTANLVFEIGEERLKCINVSVVSSSDNKSIGSPFLQTLDIDRIGKDSLVTLAWQVKPNSDEELEPAELSRGRRASKELADGVARLSSRELMFIGFHYSNPLNAKSPTKAVQIGMGYGSRHTALRRIEDARAKGWVLPRSASRGDVDAHFNEIRRRMEESNGSAS
jgi:hypothetical protein